MQVESALFQRLPSALTPAPRMVHPVVKTGIKPLDEVLRGGLPIGAITELVGPECSGRTSIALSFLAQITLAGKVCAWIDVSDAFDPPSASAAGIDLSRLLWIRCGGYSRNTRPNSQFLLPQKYFAPTPTKRGVHGGGCGPHPRGETKGLSQAVSDLLQPGITTPPRTESQHRGQTQFQPFDQQTSTTVPVVSPASKPWVRIDQALRSTDLVLQGGGFSAIVVDMGNLKAEIVSRIPLSTWFRYRAAAERTQSSILLLTQYGCAKSSVELLLRLQPPRPLCDEATIFTGTEVCVEVARRRFEHPSSNVIPLRKPPQRANVASWQSRTTWAGRR